MTETLKITVFRHFGVRGFSGGWDLGPGFEPFWKFTPYLDSFKNGFWGLREPHFGISGKTGHFFNFGNLVIFLDFLGKSSPIFPFRSLRDRWRRCGEVSGSENGKMPDFRNGRWFLGFWEKGPVWKLQKNTILFLFWIFTFDFGLRRFKACFSGQYLLSKVFWLLFWKRASIWYGFSGGVIPKGPIFETSKKLKLVFFGFFSWFFVFFGFLGVKYWLTSDF